MVFGQAAPLVCTIDLKWILEVHIADLSAGSCDW